MSTPTHDPLVVNTKDGASWTRRAVTRDGRGLYAVSDAPACCPEYVMATLAELAEHGIAGQANALPVPVGAAEPRTSQGRPRTMLDLARNALSARMAKDDLRLVLENVVTYAASLEDQRDRRRGRLVALQNDALNMRGSLSPNGENRKVPFELGETLTPAVDWLIARVAELERAAVEGRAALGALCYDLEDPGSNAFGALHLLSQATATTPDQPDDATAALARRDGGVLRQAAEDLMAACPEHGDSDEVWLNCPCEYAEELVRKAGLVEAGGAS
jgi:hypothetical protein